MQNNKVILSAENLYAGYYIDRQYIPVLEDINLNITAGESFAIIGESGSGKSTLAMAITGLLAIDNGIIKKGSIKLFGNDIINSTDNIRGKEISIVLQDPHSYLNPVLKAGEQIAEAYRVHNPDIKEQDVIKKVNSALEQVYLYDTERIYNSYPHQLSGGQKQRILIAMAIINNPKILIADEPTSGLDMSVQKEILDLFVELKHKLNLTMIMITHNILIVKKFTDRTAVMLKGKIVELGKSDELFNNPKHSYTQMLANILKKKINADRY